MIWLLAALIIIQALCWTSALHNVLMENVALLLRAFFFKMLVGEAV